MKSIELSARVDELNELADHVPVEVLASRLLAVVETYLQKNRTPAGTDTLGSIFRTLQAPTVLSGEGRPEPAMFPVESRAITGPILSIGDRTAYLPASDPSVYREWALQGDAALAYEEAMMRAADIEPEPAAETEPMRFCAKCGPTLGAKPLSEFGANKNSTDGYARTCIECTSAMRRAANVKKTEKRAREEAKAGGSGKVPAAPAAEHEEVEHEDAGDPKGDPETKECAWCGPIEGPKPLDAFAESKSKNSPDGRVSVCLDCRSSQAQRAGLASPFAASKQLAGTRSNPQPEPEPFVPKTVTTYPKTERAPEPEKKPKKRKAAPQRFCANGTDCAAYEQLDGPTKLARDNTIDLCGACQERNRKFGRPSIAKGFLKHIVRRRQGESSGAARV